ncbi:MAG: FAD-dependent oxidoreductase, partial [Oscillospiraceae bacterium]
SGLTRNLYQCLEDFNIPLHVSHTVTKIFGHERVEAVEISKVDANLQPIEGTQERIECDALILSVGLIPENELAESLDIPLDTRTKGPIADQNGMTMRDNVYVCGNALQVNDLVDYVSENAEAVGIAASNLQNSTRTMTDINYDSSFLSLIPQKLELNTLTDNTVVYFRAREDMRKTKLVIKADNNEVYTKTYSQLRPPEMERVQVDFTKY